MSAVWLCLWQWKIDAVIIFISIMVLLHFPSSHWRQLPLAVHVIEVQKVLIIFHHSFFSLFCLSHPYWMSHLSLFFTVPLHQPHSVFLFQSQPQMAWVRNNKNQPFCLLQVSHIPPLPLMVTDHSFPFCLSIWPPSLTFCISPFLPIIKRHCNFIHQHKI